MLIELLSTSNYISYNIKLAHILGLHTAIYLSELMNINDKAVRKKKISENYFTIDRKYLTDRTTFTEDEQKDIEDKLLKIGILKKSSEADNTITLDISVLTSILASPDEKLIDNIQNIIASKQKRSDKLTKQQIICQQLKAYITCENEELREAYRGWIDGVYANPKGFLSKKSIEIFQQTVDSFCNRNLDLALKIIEIATVNGYRDATWAINSYKSSFNVGYRLTNSAAPVVNSTEAPVSVSDDIF